MIDNPTINIQKSDIWYWYSSFMYLKNTPSVYLVKLIDIYFDTDTNSLSYFYEDEHGRQGMCIEQELFNSKKEAENYFQQKFKERMKKAKSKILTNEDLLKYAIRKDFNMMLSSDEIEIIIFEKAKELNII